ncbi:CbiQ family ECF transporter T component [Isoptericola sp. b441]|uniref:CbiQ family ECF transporter T component n=1 Tax=Actinotalea lenta TaxID=3064654 RepID=A0ABT9DAX8_9CELL|nr:CbiQ family ECF transporter T component [Isoptericola sp. b441]MDO8107725.1 CbiQ family ECF transporter T component [Isoptericola sp. b441]
MHPAAWWVWAAGVVVLAGRIHAPQALAALAVAACVLATAGRRQGAPSFAGYVALALGIVAVRVVFHVLVGIKTPTGRVLVDLPSWHPAWAPGVQLLGPVTTTGLGTAAAQGLALAVMVLAVGAAATASSPARLLRSLPAALHHLATAAVIAVGVAPSLVAAVAAARRARRLRGLTTRGPRAIAHAAVPVLADALDRALDLAASMEVRGYARRSGPGDRRVGPALAGAVLAAAVGTYGLLAGAPAYAVPALSLGAALAVAGASLAARGQARTRYREDPWGYREWCAAGAGAMTGVAGVAGLPLLATAIALLGLLALLPARLPAEVSV